jgi:hypothetical protein
LKCAGKFFQENDFGFLRGEKGARHRFTDVGLASFLWGARVLYPVELQVD